MNKNETQVLLKCEISDANKLTNYMNEKDKLENAI